MKKVNIYFNGILNENFGGPSGYLYNLKVSLNKYHNDMDIEFINKEMEVFYKKNKKNKLKHVIKKYLPFVYELIHIQNYKKIMKENYIENVDYKNIEIIHFHNTLDFITISPKLSEDCIKILTTHCPEAPSVELATKLEENCFNNFKYNKFKKFYHENIDNISMKNCDYLLFPSVEAMEPYYDTFPNFDEIIREKKLLFTMTGCKPLTYKIDKDSLRKKYSIPQDAFVISFVGRHNYVKGYDIAQEIFNNIKDKCENVYFIVAGTGNIKSLKHERWIEVGWTNDPGSLINASDLFLLPNRRTYFDLVLLEVLSIGIPVLASNTGGNKTVARMSEGVLLFNNEDINDAQEKIMKLSYNKERLLKMGKLNKDCYLENFTLESFFQRYCEVLKTISK